MTWRTRAVAAPRVVNIEDLRRLAKRRLPAAVFDYLDGGAEGEITLRENGRAFDALTFRPRSAIAVPSCDLRTRVLGSDLSFPALLAPVGYSRMMHPDGEVAAARGAGAAGTAYILSTISGHKLEVRNGTAQLMSGNLLGMIPFLPQFFFRPGWVASFLLDGGIHKLPNVVIPGQGPMALIDVAAALATSVVTWKDFDWLRAVWPGPIVVKGVLTGDDARRSIDAGAAGVIVSNHGGRQLDGVAATLRVLPEIVKAVNGQIEVLMDGGVRRGSDIVKAICMGARAVLVGRAYAYGLGAAGEAGVSRAVAILRADMVRTMKLLGCSSIADLNESYLNVPPNWTS